MEKKHRPERSKKATRSAARTYVQARLGWLRGFPVVMDDAVWWQTLPLFSWSVDCESVPLTRELLRRSEYGRNAAQRRFPVALADVVGDVDQWTKRTNQQFDILKAIVHNAAPLPDLDTLLNLIAARRSLRSELALFAAQAPEFVPVLEALMWVCWHESEDHLRTAFSIVDRHQRLLGHVMERIDRKAHVSTVLPCVKLLAEKNGQPFVELLADRRAWDVALADGNVVNAMQSTLKRRRKGDMIDHSNWREFVRLPPPRLGTALMDYLHELAALDRKTCRRRLRLLPAFLDVGELERWETWWDFVEALEHDVRRLVGRLPAGLNATHVQQCRDMAARIAAAPAPPASVQWRGIQDQLHELTAGASSGAFDALNACVGELDGVYNGQRLVTCFAENWINEFKKTDARWGLIEALLKAQNGILEALPELSEDRRAWIADELTQELTYVWIFKTKPRALLQPAMATLAELIKTAEEWSPHSGPFADYTGWDCLMSALELTDDPYLTAVLLATVPPKSDGLHGNAWTSLLRLSDSVPERFEAIARGWKPGHWSEASESELAVLARDKACAALLSQALKTEEGKRAARIVMLSRFCRSLGVPGVLPEPLDQPVKIAFADYPDELHDILKTLASWDQGATQASNQILGKDFPLRENLQRELSELQARVSNVDSQTRASLDARIASLARRLTTSPKVSTQRVANLIQKLERRLLHSQLARWEDALKQRLFEGLVGQKLIPEILLDDYDAVRLMSAAAGLGKEASHLAFRLARVRCGPKPWDLRDESRNADFLQRLKRSGVNTTPWLDGIGSRRIEVDGQQMTLELEDDPLETMRMGEPFSTCLAPGSFNFFSAVSNAADINKRVLYARDSNGTVQARCLLALTDAGDILTFNVYAHDNHSELAAASTRFVRGLASAMKVAVVSRGVVSKLVAQAWYDDGPVDLTGQLRFLNSESPFVKNLASIAANDFVPAIEAETREPISQFVACAVLQSQWLRDRPELAVKLMEFVGEPDTLDNYTRINVGAAARRAGNDTLAQQLLVPMVERLGPDSYYHSPILAEELLALGLPHLALRTLRKTRARWARQWEDEDYSRTRLAAQALEALHRPRQAIEMFRIAAKAGCTASTASVNRLEMEHA